MLPGDFQSFAQFEYYINSMSYTEIENLKNIDENEIYKKKKSFVCFRSLERIIKINLENSYFMTFVTIDLQSAKRKRSFIAVVLLKGIKTH